MYEACVNSVPGLKFGVAFCEASGPRLIRTEGTDDEMVGYAQRNAMKVGVGHSFFVFLKTPAFPLHVLPAIKNVNTVTRVYCATANPTKVVVGCIEEQRGVACIVDGFKPLGVESDEDKKKRKEFLQMIGYKK